jgi:hypothetical protein
MKRTKSRSRREIEADQELLSFDRDGTFRISGSRWIRVYRLSANVDRPDLSGINSRMRFTVELPEKQAYLTLTAEAQSYSEAKKQVAKEEELLRQSFLLQPLSADEILKRYGSGFTYAAMIRGKKDWRENCLPKIGEELDSFVIGEAEAQHGEVLFTLQYPEGLLEPKMLDTLGNLGCPVYISLETENLSPEVQEDFRRVLEDRYNRRAAGNGESLVNLSLQLAFLSDSREARTIIEETILRTASKEGFVLAPAYGNQRQVLSSIRSLGWIDHPAMRNVGEGLRTQILETGASYVSH